MPFLNAAIEISTQRSPLELLHDLQQLEVAAGRPGIHDHHAPRTLDLDLLYVDDLSVSLTLPHPRIAQRIFVLQPLADICPERRLPALDRSIRELCDDLTSGMKSEAIKIISHFL
jgi:2-amino-4-hydroxy-6-hydroxymethyldihydropteridine diphosphokinase